MSGPDNFRIERLAPEHDLGAFDCDAEYYNSWLLRHARAADSNGTSAVYVLLAADPAEEAGRVWGYFAICPTTVLRSEVPKKLLRSLLVETPGWLLAKLALDRTLRGDAENQWGRHLLRAALETIVDVAGKGGGQIIVVDAENAKVQQWYSDAGFLTTGVDNLRLYMKIATARQYLQA